MLEYADVVWDNCTDYELKALEKIQLEAARIVTGATKLVSFENLYKESGLEKLEVRRSKHKLCLFYKMSNNISPDYLSTLQRFHNLLKIQLVIIYVTLRIYANLFQEQNCIINHFLPSSIKLWNDLSFEIREAPSFTSFKYQVNKNIKQVAQGQRSLT